MILSHDSDFLVQDTNEDVVVLYYGDDTMDSFEIADRVDKLTEWIPDPTDLPRIVNLAEWE